MKKEILPFHKMWHLSKKGEKKSFDYDKWLQGKGFDLKASSLPLDNPKRKPISEDYNIKLNSYIVTQ